MLTAGSLGFAGCRAIVKQEDWDLERADALARAQGGKGWAAWHGGRIEKQWRSRERGPVYSITKALAGLAAAKAASEGWLGADEKVADTIHEWRGHPGKSAITVRMLLQQTAGLDAGAAALYRSPKDKGKAAVGLVLVDAPGAQFRYGPACWEVLAELLERKAASRGGSLLKFMGSGVMSPLGLSSPDWRSDGRERIYLSTGAELSAHDLGKLGQAISRLANGSRVAGIDPARHAEMIQPSAANPIFGGGVWRNRMSPHGVEREIEDTLDPPRSAAFWRSTCLSRSQPPSMLALIGSSGKRVFIWPDRGRVMARLGASAAWRDGPFLAALK